MDEKCVYANDMSLCTALIGTYCTGYKSKRLCSFHKTVDENIEETNKAITINRIKGNCSRCKYRNVKCQLIGTEEEE